MRLHFPWPAVEQALEELRTAGAARTLYDQDTGKGLWLVGDRGVYLMPNTTDGLHNRDRSHEDGNFVVYARECDPTKLDFDTWWENKRSSFGTDDGVEFLSMETIENLSNVLPTKSRFLAIDLSPDNISIGIL